MKKKKEQREKESGLLPATTEMLTISMCLCVFAKSPIPPSLFFSGRVPLLLPLAKQTIKSMHGSGRDSTRCKHFRQPTTVFLPGLGCSSPPLIGCGARTDVSSLMIFVTIKLIVVYGSEMQECGGGSGGRGAG